jgi:hypothetical protein
MRTRIIAGIAWAAALLAAAPGQGKDASASVMDPSQKVATFAGGCFWCMEPPFDKVQGVLSTTSGYTGGHQVKPTYEEVSSGTTGHAESVQIVYDPSKVSYERRSLTLPDSSNHPSPRRSSLLRPSIRPRSTTRTIT